MKTKNKIRLTFFKQLESAVQQIRDDCRRNQQPDTYSTAYKPLLMERSANYRKNNQTMRYLYEKQKSISENKRLLRSSQPFNRTFTPTSKKIQSSQDFSSLLTQYRPKTADTNRKYSSMRFDQSREQIKLDGVSYFIRKLYFAKTKDLSIQPNSKQQKNFIARLKQLVNQSQFVTPESDFGLHSMNIIGKFLSNYPVAKLVLDKNPIGDFGALKIAQIIPSSKISELSLVSINISPKSASSLISSFAGHPDISILNLSSSDGLNRNRINPQAYVQMKRVLDHPICKIKVLNLSNTSMGQIGFINFCKCFEKNHNLEFKLINLSLNQITITEQNESVVRNCLMNICVSRLEFQNNNIGDMGAKIIAPVFGGKLQKSIISHHLTYLDLSNNNIKSYGFEALCNFLPGNKKITEFYMNDNNLSERQIFYCVKQLLNYTWSIKKLSLRNTLKTTPSTSLHLKSLSEGLLRNKSIRELDISYNPIGVDSFVQIFDHLQQNNILKMIVMEGCEIEDQHLAKAEQLIKNLRTIVSINLCNNGLTDKGGNTLIKILASSHSITEVNIKKNCINIHVFNSILYQLKENKLMAQTRGDPEFNYINYIMGMHTEQKKNLQKQIEEISTKQKKKITKCLAIDVVGKQDQIAKKQEEIKAESLKIGKIESEINNIVKQKQKKKSYSCNNNYIRQDSFLVTN